VHSPFTGSVIETLVAVTAPEESLLPWADAHLPTCTAAAVADCSVVIFVVAARVIVLSVVAVDAVDPCPKVRAATTSVPPDTDTTDPLANAVCVPAPAVRAPLGNEPGERVPDGRAPDGKAPVGAPDGRAPPPNPASHVPFAGLLTETVAAVNVLAVDAVPELATTVTQSPATIVLASTLACWVKVVVAVQVTATWPFC
jgi:hypothetical protein